MNRNLRRLAVPVLSLLSGAVLAQGVEAQIRIDITKPGPSVAGAITVELHGAAPALPCLGVEPCPGPGGHVLTAAAPVPVGPGTTVPVLAAALAAALTAAGAPTVADATGITILAPPPGTDHCCVSADPEDVTLGHSMTLPLCVVNNIADGLTLNGGAAPTGGFTFTKQPPKVPAVSGWGVLAMAVLVLSSGAFVLTRQGA